VTQLVTLANGTLYKLYPGCCFPMQTHDCAGARPCVECGHPDRSARCFRAHRWLSADGEAE
jgi:hypothetical protein